MRNSQADPYGALLRTRVLCVRVLWGSRPNGPACVGPWPLGLCPRVPWWPRVRGVIDLTGKFGKKTVTQSSAPFFLMGTSELWGTEGRPAPGTPQAVVQVAPSTGRLRTGSRSRGRGGGSLSPDPGRMRAESRPPLLAVTGGRARLARMGVCSVPGVAGTSIRLPVLPSGSPASCTLIRGHVAPHLSLWGGGGGFLKVLTHAGLCHVAVIHTFRRFAVGFFS